MNIEASDSDTTERKPKTIRQFCDTWEFSPSFYFKLQKQGRGPRTIRIGPKKVLITPAAEDDWAARLERESA